MSWLFTASGYLRSGGLEEGTLPLALPQADADRVEAINPGSAAIARRVWISAMDLARSGMFGDPNTARFAITISGHVQKVPVRGWSRNFTNISVGELESNDSR